MFIIVRFAILEFKYGEEDHGAAIFETVLSSDPKELIYGQHMLIN